MTKNKQKASKVFIIVLNTILILEASITNTLIW